MSDNRKYYYLKLKENYFDEDAIVLLESMQVERIAEHHWDELGMPETLWCCKVKEFGPLIVSIDSEGRNMFEENKVVFNQKKDAAVEEICKHVSFIK